MISEIKDILTNNGYSIKDISSNRIAIITDKVNRLSVIDDVHLLLNPYGFYINSTPTQASSIGCLENDKLKVYVKPESKQGILSPGKMNEELFFKKIRSIIRFNGVMNIIFSTGKKSFVVKNVIAIRKNYRDRVRHRKADFIFVNIEGKEIPISLKMDSAEMWESADSYFRGYALEMLEESFSKNIASLQSCDTHYRLNKSIAKKIKKDVAHYFVFGTDILEKSGAVIISTYDRLNFSFNDQTGLRVKCSHILSDKLDIRNDLAVYLLVRNDKSRRIVNFYPGVRYLAVFKSRINKNVSIL